MKKLLESERTEITFSETSVNKYFVKMFREKNSLTQIALANILGVKKKTIEKWEQGANNVNGSSAVLLKLLDDNPTLIEQLYKVEKGIKGPAISEEYETVSCNSFTENLETIGKSGKVYSKILPFAATFII